MTRFQIYPKTELVFKYTKPFYKTQYSGSLVEYKQGLDMNTGKLFIQSMATHHSTSDKNSYIPVNLLKTQETLVKKSIHKTQTVHVYERQYSLSLKESTTHAQYTYK